MSWQLALQRASPGLLAPAASAAPNTYAPTFDPSMQSFLEKNSKMLRHTTGHALYNPNSYNGLSSSDPFKTRAAGMFFGNNIQARSADQAQANARNYADSMSRFYQVAGLGADKRDAKYAAQGNIYDQLQGLSKSYGFDWGQKVKADHAYNVSKALGGVQSLSDLKWDGKNLTDTRTGRRIDMDKGNQLSYSAGGSGDGFVRYKVANDAAGNAVFYPEWEESSDKGKIANAISIAAAFIPGIGPLASAAIAAGTQKLAGASWGDALKAGALAGVGSGLTRGIGATVGKSVAGATGSKLAGQVATGALSGGAKGLLSGGDVLKSALMGGVSAGAGSAANTAAGGGALGKAAGSFAGAGAGALAGGAKFGDALKMGLLKGAGSAAGSALDGYSFKDAANEPQQAPQATEDRRATKMDYGMNDYFGSGPSFQSDYGGFDDFNVSPDHIGTGIEFGDYTDWGGLMGNSLGVGGTVGSGTDWSGLLSKAASAGGGLLSGNNGALLAALGGGLLGKMGNKSSGGGKPVNVTANAGGFKGSIPFTADPIQQLAMSLPTSGQANDGLWRFMKGK